MYANTIDFSSVAACDGCGKPLGLQREVLVNGKVIHSGPTRKECFMLANLEPETAQRYMDENG